MSQTITGGRALLYLPDNTGNLVLAGVYESVSRNRSVGTEAIFTLGQYSAREIAIHSLSEVSVSCSGLKILDKGTVMLGAYPTLANVLNYQSCVIKVVDRQTGRTMMVITGAVPSSDSESHNVRATSKVSISYTGIASFDESLVDASGTPTDSEGTPSFP